MPKTWCCYVIENSPNGKKYVGLTGTPARRWASHLSSSKSGSVQTIHRAIRKYGAANFSFNVIEWCASESDAKAAEVFWIDWYQTFGVYNQTRGGDGTTGRLHTKEAKAKISEAKTGRPLSPEHVAKLRGRSCPFFAGRRHTAAARAKISAAHVGKIVGAETRAKMSAASSGRKLSAAHAEKLKAGHGAHKAKIFAALNTPEAKAKRRASKVGVPMSAEARINMSRARKGKPLSDKQRDVLRRMSERNTGKTRSAEDRAKIAAGHARRKDN